MDVSPKGELAGWLRIVLSPAALAPALSHAAILAAVNESEEDMAASPFPILLALQLPMAALFVSMRTPWQSCRVYSG